MAIQGNRAQVFSKSGKQTTVPVNRPLPRGFEKIPGELNTRELQQGRYMNIQPVGTGPGSYLMGQLRQFNLPSQPQGQLQQQANPAVSFNNAIMELLKQAQSGQGDQDLEAQRNALIQARFGTRTAPTSEELRALSPSQQAALRGQDVSGIETQLSGVTSALTSRKNERTQNLNMLKTFQDMLKPDIQIISETDNDGNVSIISVDKATGDVVSKNVYQGVGKKAERNTQVIGVGNRKVLIDSQTGQVIRDLGVKPSSGSGVALVPIIPQPIKTFEQYLNEEQQKAGQTFNPVKREVLRQQFESQKTQQPQVDISKFDSTVQMVIRGLKSVDSIGDVEYRRIKNQLNQAYNAGLIQEQPLSGQKQTVFNRLIDLYNKSPLILAADRTTVLENSIKDIRKDPKAKFNQMNLTYSYIQALDTYQSAVREGELGLVNSIDSKIGKIKNYVQQIENGQIVRPSVALEMATAAESIINTIKNAAKAKKSSFRSQAVVNGLEKEWDRYESGFTPSYQEQKTPERPSINSFIR